MPTDEMVDRLHWFQLDRREFLRLCGGGLLVYLTGARGEAQESGRGSRDQALPQEIKIGRAHV